MKLERALQINIALLVVLGTLMLSLGRPGSGFALMVAFVAVTSVVFTDMLGWFRLNRLLANLIGGVAAFFCLSVFFQTRGPDQMTAIARFLIYLQIVLLYQEKKVSTYWYLAVLSLLEVVIASAMSLGLNFGLLLALYMVATISALSLFFIYRETGRIVRQPGNGSPLREPDVDADAGALGRLLGARPLAAPNCRRQDLVSPLCGGRLYRQIGAFVMATLMFTVVLFFTTPRLGGNYAWQMSAFNNVSLVGYSVNVNLSNRNRVLQNDQLVMRVSLFDDATGEPFAASGEIYFQGGVLNRYDLDRQSWTNQTRREFHNNFSSGRHTPLRRANADQRVIRLEVIMQPADHPILFGVYPPVAVSATEDRVVLNTTARRLVRNQGRDSESLQRPFQYVIGTTAFRSTFQTKTTVHHVRNRNIRFSDLLLMDGPAAGLEPILFQRLTDFNRTKFSGVAEKAEQVLQELQIDRKDTVAVARALEGHFFGGSYTYTLDLNTIQRREYLDPIEDFVVNHQSGHCQYFASALAMMLRSQGIPARMVNGYKGGEYNSVGKYYLVRQRHAHAWVEAYLAPQHARKLLGPSHPEGQGAWMRLDPTPAAGLFSDQVVKKGFWDRAGDMFQYAQMLWSDYVLGLNSSQQHKVLYDPLESKNADMLQRFFSIRVWIEAVQRLATRLGFDFSSWRLQEWFSWRGGLAAVVICLILVGLSRVVKWTWPRWLGIWRRNRSQAERPPAPRVEFYEQLAELLRREGVQRDASQTQREFAAAAAGHLSERQSSHLVRQLPRGIVEAFYRVRFGGEALDKEEREKIEQALVQLEAALAPEPTAT